MKTLWMVGGGLQHVRAIKIAKKLGYKIVVSDRKKNCACANFADEFVQIDGRDIESLISFGLTLKDKNKLDGVFTFTELTTSVAAITQALGLPGSSLIGSVNAQDKGRSKTLWSKKKVSIANGFLYFGQKGAESKIKKLNFPLIIKPIKGSGGIGIIEFKSYSVFYNWLKVKYKKISYENRMVIEEKIEGTSHDVNGIIDNKGKFHPYGIVDRTFVKDFPVEESVTAPTKLDDKRQTELYKLLENSVRSLGINFGPVKGDAILTKKGFKILEVGTRLHGPKFSLYAMPSITTNYLVGFFSLISGGNWKKDFNLKTNGYNFKSKIILPKTGKIKSITGIKKLKLTSNLELMLFKKSGDIISKPKNSHEAFGYFIARGKSESKLGLAIDNAMTKLKVKLL